LFQDAQQSDCFSSETFLLGSLYGNPLAPSADKALLTQVPAVLLSMLLIIPHVTMD